MGHCFECGASFSAEGVVGRVEVCSGCGADLHVCYNCDHYEPNCENECREPVAERVVDKNRSNFCDYFRPKEKGTAKKSSSEEARDRFRSLFGKK